MSPEPDETKTTPEEAIGNVARHAAKEQTGRWLAYATAVGLVVIVVAGILFAWWIAARTDSNSRDIARQAIAAAAKDQARQQQTKTVQDQIDTLRSQVDAINVKREQSGLPPIKQVAPDVQNDAAGSSQTKQNTELIARLAAALVPAPKNGRPGKTGKAGPVGVSVSHIAVIDCTLTLGTSDGKSYAGNVCGPPGKIGPQGIQGIPGKDGASAYAIWLSAGHVGTVQDFLASLQGDPGRGVVAIGTTGKDATGCQRITVQYTDDQTPTPIGDPICDGTDGRDGADSTVPGPAGPKGDPGPVVNAYTKQYDDGSTETCTRDGGTDTDPHFTCTTAPPTTIPTGQPTGTPPS